MGGGGSDGALGGSARVLAGPEGGGNPCWYPLYRRILDAGKSVQVVHIHPDEVVPLLKAVGARGLFILTHFESTEQAERLMEEVEPYR